jgi:hypothetical protein
MVGRPRMIPPPPLIVTPIIVGPAHTSREREFIVVDGHKYYREEETSSRETGVVILVSLIYVAMLGLAMNAVMEHAWSGWWIAAAGLGPPLLLAIGMIVFS